MDVTEANDKPFNFKTPLLISKGSAETLSSKIYTIYNFYFTTIKENCND